MTKPHIVLHLCALCDRSHEKIHIFALKFVRMSIEREWSDGRTTSWQKRFENLSSLSCDRSGCAASVLAKISIFLCSAYVIWLWRKTVFDRRWQSANKSMPSSPVCTPTNISQTFSIRIRRSLREALGCRRKSVCANIVDSLRSNATEIHYSACGIMKIVIIIISGIYHSME